MAREGDIPFLQHRAPQQSCAPRPSCACHGRQLVRGAQAEPSKLNQRLQLQSALPVSAPRARTNARTHAAAGRATNTLRGCLGQKCHTLPPATRRTLPHLLGKTVEAKSYATCSAAAACASTCGLFEGTRRTR